MLLRRPLRRLVALGTVLIVMLCPMAYAMHVYGHSFEAKGIAAPTCHEVPGDTQDSPSSPEPAAICSASTMVADDVTFSLPAISDLPASLVVAAPALPVAPLPRYRHSIRTLYHPPPLRVALCRFLN